MLLFKKKFHEAIRRGEKTQTIRLWERRRMKSGQRSYIPGIGYIAILSVDPVELDALTDADAIPDGFPTADRLRDELRTLYAEEIARNHRAFRVRFAVYPPQEQLRMKLEQKKRKEADAARDRQQRDRTNKERVDKTLAKLRRMAER